MLSALVVAALAGAAAAVAPRNYLDADADSAVSSVVPAVSSMLACDASVNAFLSSSGFDVPDDLRSFFRTYSYCDTCETPSVTGHIASEYTSYMSAYSYWFVDQSAVIESLENACYQTAGDDASSGFASSISSAVAGSTATSAGPSATATAAAASATSGTAKTAKTAGASTATSTGTATGTASTATGAASSVSAAAANAAAGRGAMAVVAVAVLAAAL